MNMSILVERRSRSRSGSGSGSVSYVQLDAGDIVMAYSSSSDRSLPGQN